jgi:hypothetical protein
MANKADRDINRMLQATKMADRRNFRNMVGENYYLVICGASDRSTLYIPISGERHS